MKSSDPQQHPKTLPPRFERFPKELTVRNGWVLWKWKLENNVWKKPPLQINGMLADINKHDTYSFDQIRGCYNPSEHDGVGIILKDDLIAIDLDDCVSDGATTRETNEIFRYIRTYTELSPSGTGLHVFARGSLPGSRRKNGNFEMYGAQTARYMTVTGIYYPGTPNSVYHVPEYALKKFYDSYIEPPWQKSSQVTKTTRQPDNLEGEQDASQQVMEPPLTYPEPEEVLTNILNSDHAENFQKLMDGNHEDYRSSSEADLAFCSIVSQFSKGNKEVIDALFRQSNLSREKWERADYRKNTLNKATQYTSTTSEWPMPEPIDGSRDLPEFPLTSLPEQAKNYVMAVAEYLQVPVDLPAIMLLTCVSAAAAKKYSISSRTDWHEPANIYTLTVLKTGEKKTPVVNEFQHPFHSYMQENNKKLELEIQKATTHRKVLERKINRCEKDMAEASPDKQEKCQQLLDQAIEELHRHQVPNKLDLITSDITPESLAEQLCRNQEKMAFISDEAGILETLDGRYSQGVPNYEIFLKAHTGSSVAVHRKGKEPLHLHQPALTIGILAQPVAIDRILQVRGAMEKGLIPRFLFSIPANSKVGYRKIDTTPIPHCLKEWYENLIYKLLELKAATNSLEFTYTGRAILMEFYQQLEAQRKPHESHCDIIEWSQKIEGQTARICLLLHLLEGKGAKEPVSEETVSHAIEITNYYVTHAKYALTKSTGYEPEKFALRVIENKKLQWVRSRDLQRASSARFKSADMAKEVLEKLDLLGYVRYDTKKRAYEVHPDIERIQKEDHSND